MGSSQRLAAVAAVSHARHYYNHTQTDTTQPENTHTVNIFFVSITLCGVLVAVCAACWRRSSHPDKPENVTECRGVYIVSADPAFAQAHVDTALPGPPPAYETVVEGPLHHEDCINDLKEVVTEPCPQCQHSSGCDTELPSYEAAVMLRDTKL
ncbi:uncharacterized protein LOC115453090 [Manduca sexta]|uniref:Uncharacterized protein n=1 Tax=Manduca sexta TaxID=7130 RepID=A0A921ZVK6_MANSE|nr:uncharacterized protein LOC115453090 [Manduca sexta]KAG6464454.1 hypothetical protein O3G_MSEX014524 [Manduca sexta]